MRGKASGDLDSLQAEYNSLKDARISSQKEFAKIETMLKGWKY